MATPKKVGWSTEQSSNWILSKSMESFAEGEHNTLQMPLCFSPWIPHSPWLIWYDCDVTAIIEKSNARRQNLEENKNENGFVIFDIIDNVLSFHCCCYGGVCKSDFRNHHSLLLATAGHCDTVEFGDKYLTLFVAIVEWKCYL